MDGDIMTVRDAAARLDVHENTIRNWMDNGSLDYVQQPHFRRPTRRSVETLAHAMLPTEGARKWVVIETRQTQRTWVVTAETAFKASRMVKGMKPAREHTTVISKETTLRG